MEMKAFEQMGFTLAVMGLDTIMHAAKAVEAVLTDMKSGIRQALRRHGIRDL